MRVRTEFTLKAFDPDHARHVLDSLIELKYVVAPRDRWDRSIRMWQSGCAFTLMADEVIVGCGGVMMPEQGKGEAWIIATPLIRRYKKSVFKLLHNMLGAITTKYRLRRVEALCPGGYAGGARLLKHLGFINETPDGMKQYGPGGETFYLYGRVTEWPA